MHAPPFRLHIEQV
jgi:hypothetical protein